MTEPKEGCKNCKNRWNNNNHCHEINMIVDTDNGWCDKFDKRSTDGMSLSDMIKEATTVMGVTGTYHPPTDVADELFASAVYAMARGEVPPILAPPARATTYYVCPECNHAYVSDAWDEATIIAYENDDIESITNSGAGCDFACPSCGMHIMYEEIEQLRI